MNELAERKRLIAIRPRPKVCPVECPLHPGSAAHNPTLSGGYVPPHLLPKSQLLAVGIGPGEEEELAGVPLIGPSGRYSDHALTWAGGPSCPLPYDKINIVNCRTVKPSARGGFVNRTPPTTTEQRTCFGAHLRPLLRKKHYRVVLLLGKDAYNLVLPHRVADDHKRPPWFDQFGKAMGHRLVLDIEKDLPGGTYAWRTKK